MTVNDVSADTHGSHWKDIIAHRHRELEVFRLETGRDRPYIPVTADYSYEISVVNHTVSCYNYKKRASGQEASI